MRTMEPVCITTKLSFPYFKSIKFLLAKTTGINSIILNKNTNKKYVWIKILNSVLFPKYILNILIDITTEMIL